MDMGFKARNRDIWRWRKAGLTFSEIGKRVGVSAGRAWQIARKVERIENSRPDLLRQEREEFAAHMKFIWPRENAKRK